LYEFVENAPKNHEVSVRGPGALQTKAEFQYILQITYRVTRERIFGFTIVEDISHFRTECVPLEQFHADCSRCQGFPNAHCGRE
jgi:hypothetical protein